MFIDIRNLQERRQTRDSQFEDTRDIRNGYLFEVNGSVEGDRDGLVWFKARDGNSQPFQVFYGGVIGDIRANMFVKIERDPKDPARWQVIEFDTGIYFNDQSTYEQLPSLSAIPAKEDYEWPPGFPGAKALNIFPRAITDFAVRPTSPASMKARVYSGIYPGATNYARFQGPVNTKDFTADVPGAGLARLAAISIDNSGTLNYTNGTTFVDGLPMPDASLPSVPASQMLISAIRLVNGMTAIEESNFDLEMRPLMANGTVNVKVSEIWESDFGAVAMQADATGQIEVGKITGPDAKFEILDTSAQLRLTFEDGVKFADFAVDTNHDLTIDPSSTGLIKLAATVTVPDDIQHEGDLTSKLSFATGQWDLDVTGINMIRAHNTAQDILLLGDVAGTGDVDINFNNGDMFLEGSSGNLSIGTAVTAQMSIVSNDNSKVSQIIKQKSGQTAILTEWQDSSGVTLTSVSRFGILFTSTSSGTVGAGIGGTSIELQNRDSTVGNRSGFIGKNSNSDNLGAYQFVADSHVAGTGQLRMGTFNAGTYAEVIRVDSNGLVGINGVTSPSTELDIGAGAIEQEEMTDPGAGAANTTRTFAEDNAGTTRQRVGFSSGNVVTIAEDGGLQTYTITNVVTDRAYDANATSVAELADVLGTLIADFQAAGILG